MRGVEIKVIRLNTVIIKDHSFLTKNKSVIVPRNVVT